MKLALGTAQFGLSYGIANSGGRVRRKEVAKILSLARISGIDMLDTASAYGYSEACLGAVGTQGFKVVTKIHNLPNESSELYSYVHNQLQTSLRLLGLDSVYGLLLHRPQQLIEPSGRSLVQALEQLKDRGLVQKIGVSIYDPKELDFLTQVCQIDLVQAPLNLIDHRLITTGWLQRLHDMGVEVHTRSAFLQGLLLMPRETIPEKFNAWSHLFDHWHAWLNENRATSAEACLSFVTSQPLIDRVVVGVDSYTQIQELLKAELKKPQLQLPNLCCDDVNLINPSNWSSM